MGAYAYMHRHAWSRMNVWAFMHMNDFALTAISGLVLVAADGRNARGHINKTMQQEAIPL